MISTTADQALAHYTQHYDNNAYVAIQVAIVRDTCGVYQAQVAPLFDRALATKPIQRLLNLLTDTALEGCGHPFMRGRKALLIRAVYESELTAPTIRLLGEYLGNFEGENGTFASDFENRALALLALKNALLALKAVNAHSSHIHTALGNVTGYVTTGATVLLQVAQAILQGETDATHLNAKMQAVQTAYQMAQEGLSLLTFTPILPHKTLLIAQDKTYVGLVTHVLETGVVVCWYKWGFEGETIREFMAWSDAQRQTLTHEECTQRFGGLPKLDEV
jgi:hypothetical protein